jgi:hypothetical protein
LSKIVAILYYTFLISFFGLVGSAQAAYIDPNTGGMLFQILAIMFGTISGLILLFSGKIKMWFYRARRSVKEENKEEIEED